MIILWFAAEVLHAVSGYRGRKVKVLLIYGNFSNMRISEYANVEYSSYLTDVSVKIIRTRGTISPLLLQWHRQRCGNHMLRSSSYFV